MRVVDGSRAGEVTNETVDPQLPLEEKPVGQAEARSCRNGIRTRLKTWEQSRKVRALEKKFSIFVNPRLLAFTRPCFLACVIGFLSLAVFVAYTWYLLGQCEKKSFTTTTRSEMVNWFAEEEVLDPMNNYQKNWKCLYYTAKLMATEGDLFPEVSSSYSLHNDYYNNCADTGRCEHRYVYKSTPGHLRYEKCDIGTVRYTKKAKTEFYHWLADLEERYYETSDLFSRSNAVLTELEQTLSSMLEHEEGSFPVNEHGYEDFVWIAAHDVHKVPGAFDEVMEIFEGINNCADYNDCADGYNSSSKIPNDHPLWLFLQSEPYTKFDGVVVESENKLKFQENYGMQYQLSDTEVDLVLQDPRVRLRSTGGGEFPGLCKDSYYDSSSYSTDIWYGTDQPRTAIGVPGEPRCHYGSAANLSHSVLGFEFKLLHKDTVQTAYDDQRILNLLVHDARVQYIKDNRHLTRSMFCNPDDYDEMILFRAPVGMEHCKSDTSDDPECTLVKKCDLTGMRSATKPGFTSFAFAGEPALQPEHGSFLAVVEVCPKLLDTMGVALGFIGQIEMFITLLTMACFLSCGCVKVQGEDETRSLRGRIAANLQLALDVAQELEADPGDATPSQQAPANVHGEQARSPQSPVTAVRESPRSSQSPP